MAVVARITRSIVEQALLRALQGSARLRSLAKTIAPYQGQLDQELTQITDALPGVYVMYERSDARPLTALEYERDFTFTILVCTASLASRNTARIGAQNSVGTYDLLDEVEYTLAGSRLGIDNLHEMQLLEEIALVNTISMSIYAATYISRQNTISTAD